MAAQRKGHATGKRAPKSATTRSHFRSVSIEINGSTITNEPGALAQVIGESFAMARDGLSGTFKVHGIISKVEVIR
jgi:hypothetical protein